MDLFVKVSLPLKRIPPAAPLYSTAREEHSDLCRSTSEAPTLAQLTQTEKHEEKKPGEKKNKEKKPLHSLTFRQKLTICERDQQLTRPRAVEWAMSKHVETSWSIITFHSHKRFRGKVYFASREEEREY